MKISVVVITRNEEFYIADLLDSLVSQSRKPYEIIVVDAESTDRTQKIVTNYKKKYEYIRLYVARGNRAEGRNYGSARAKGDIVAFIDADCIANSFWVEELEKSMKKAEVVAGKSIRLGYHGFMDLERVGMFHKGVDVTYPSCNLAYKKSTFDDIGGFDPWFKEAEELDLNFRAIDANYKLSYNDSAIVYHRLRESVHGFFKQSFWYGFGRKELTQKHGVLWSKYNVLDMVRMSANESIWKLIRLIIASAGYFFCKLFSRKGREMEMKEKFRQSKLSDRRKVDGIKTLYMMKQIQFNLW